MSDWLSDHPITRTTLDMLRYIKPIPFGNQDGPRIDNMLFNLGARGPSSPLQEPVTVIKPYDMQ